MKILDRYLLGELFRAALGGLLLFVGVVVCVYELQQFIRFVVRRGYPPGVAGEIFLLHLPQAAGWVLPIAVIFGVIMAIGRLSADGELTAMHAGGISFRRILVPVAFVGLLGVLSLYVLNEVLSPRAMSRARDLIWEYGGEESSQSGFSFTEKEDGEIVRHVFAAEFDPSSHMLTGVVIAEFRNRQVWQTIRAKSAVWRGKRLCLTAVELARYNPEDRTTVVRFDALEYDVREAPEELARSMRRPAEMTLTQLRKRIKELYARKADVNQEIRPLEQQIAVRRAAPWCALGFALVSAPLGLRRVRTSTGVSVGLAVLVFLPYYFVSYTLQVAGKHGGIHPEIPAWTGNIILFLVAAGLILDSSR